MFVSTADAIGYWTPWIIGVVAIFATILVFRKPKRKKGSTDAFAPHVDEEGREWRRTLDGPPPWSKK